MILLGLTFGFLISQICLLLLVPFSATFFIGWQWTKWLRMLVLLESFACYEMIMTRRIPELVIPESHACPWSGGIQFYLNHRNWTWWKGTSPNNVIVLVPKRYNGCWTWREGEGGREAIDKFTPWSVSPFLSLLQYRHPLSHGSFLLNVFASSNSPLRYILATVTTLFFLKHYFHHFTLQLKILQELSSDYLSGVYDLLQSESHIFSYLIYLPTLVPCANQSALLTITEHTVCFPYNTFTLFV